MDIHKILLKELLVCEDYQDNKANRKKNSDELVRDGWVKINPNGGDIIQKTLHVTDDNGLRFIKNNLNKIQLSTFTKGKIGGIGSQLLIIKGLLNQSFSGDAGTVVDEENIRWYKPENITKSGVYNELVVVPHEIIDVIKVEGDVTASDYI